MNFSVLKEAVSKQMKSMEGLVWFASNASKDDLWDTYLGSFKPEDNPIFRERTEHDCSCCKQFIRSAGNILAELNGELVSVWDIQVGGKYQPVVDAMAKLVKEAGIDTIYKHYEKNVGTDQNVEETSDGPIVWKHFHHELPNAVVMKASNIGAVQGRAKDHKATLERSIKEIEPVYIETVLDLIADKSLYKGDEYKSILVLLQRLQREYATASNQEIFLWENSLELGGASAIRSSVIGTLLTDLSKGIDLEDAVKMFESKVAPQNYKRSKALITPSMIKQAEKKVAELGIEPALHRRHATQEDVTLNNVLFADRTVKESKGVFGELMKQTADPKVNLDSLVEVSVEEFLTDYLPKADSLEVMFENAHTSNLMTLVAPVNADAPSILKWDNNFTHTYNGDVTDSMAELVKSHGGKVEGDLRFSIKWNEDNQYPHDLDAHCSSVHGHIFYQNKMDSAKGYLDVDITNPGNKVAVENIVWPDVKLMKDGPIKFGIVDFYGRGNADWEAEIAFEGEIHTFSGNIPKGTKSVEVATVLLKDGKFSINNTGTVSTKEVWGINTQKFHKVDMAMFSPNHWDDNSVGHKHLFFILEDCTNPDKVRGLYNEFLSQELQENRKVFEVLGSQLKAEYSPNQLSGLGFSFTKRASVVCKVRGEINRNIKINF